MANSRIMNEAKERKDDEYYTLYEDIADELPKYKKQFKGKNIICPCDWDESFDETLVYASEEYVYPADLTLFSEGGTIKKIDIQATKAKIEPDFDSIKCNFVKFLVAHAEDCKIKSISVSGYNPELDRGVKFQDIDYSKYDLVITNPPFSQITEFFDIMMENNKKFLVIGPLTAIGYKDCFRYIKTNKIWLGYEKQLIGFNRPDGTKLLSKDKEGSVPRACKWFTNLDVSYRHDKIILTEKYEDYKYTKYDNFDGINIEDTLSIPYDYEGYMGVPLSFLQKYNPDQFELIGIGSGNSAKEIGITRNYRGRTDLAITLPDGTHKCPFGRIVVKNKEVYHDED